MRSWRGSEDAFMLVFRGPEGPQLPQSVATIAARGLRPTRLLVSPSSIRRGPQYYSAVINRTAPRRS